jgi:mannosyltransferase OCH1-like enzyme
MIPKIIWQTYEVDYDDLRNDYKMASLTWKNLNPEWEYRYCNAEQRRKHVEEYDKEILEFYDICDGVSQSDIWRWIVLYQYGGVYSDMDSVCNMPLDSMFDTFPISKDVVCVPRIEGLLITGTFAAKKKSNVFKNTIEKIGYGKMVEQYNGPVAHIGWENIHPVILEKKDNIDFLFMGVMHGSHAGNQFKYTSNFNVQYNGEKIRYSDLAKLNNWIY